MKILLIDDSPKQRRSGKAALEAKGHVVVAVSSYTAVGRDTGVDIFDAALIDLMMPAESMMLGPDALAKHLGQEIGVGFPMIFALALQGIEKIAVVTDASHHADPMSAMVDWFHHATLKVNGSTVRILHAKLTVDGTKDWCQALEILENT